jgi:hypothetical protein
MLRRRLPALLALALASTLLVVGGAAAHAERATGGYNLSGVWKNPDGPGTTLVLRQTGRVITWQGGPNNHAWIQNFSGVLALPDNTFSGTFWQDEPKRNPQRYHGHMEARIEDSCHFRFTLITQDRQPTLHDGLFTKTPCTLSTPPAKRLQLNLYLHRFVPNTATMAASCPAVNECVVANHAPVRFCNHSEYNHAPFTLVSDNLIRGSRKPYVLLRPGQCFTHRFVNTETSPIVVKVFDALHSNERFLVTVMP